MAQGQHITNRPAQDVFDFSFDAFVHRSGTRGPWVALVYQRKEEVTDDMELLISDLRALNEALEQAGVKILNDDADYRVVPKG